MTRLLLATFALAAIIGCYATGVLLNRIDAANAYSARAYAHTKLLEVELVWRRAHPVEPERDPNVAVCIDRTAALREAMQTWTRIGRAEFAEWPGSGWAGEWP